MPLLETRGAASVQGFGGLAAAAGPLYVDDVFSTYLYNGNGSTQTITNGIDLAGQGGIVWIKRRDSTENHFLFDTARGTTAELNSNTTDASATLANSVTAFNSNGFSLGSATGVNTNTGIYTSWAFRKAPKFFDVVTYTGNGGTPQTINHNLGVEPGMIVVKATNTTGSWRVYHRSLGYTQYMPGLEQTAAAASSSTVWNSAPTSTTFQVGTSLSVNTSGTTYVAYLFAHDTAADGLIQCGSASLDVNQSANVTLGWEPQFVLVKLSSTTSDWRMVDTLRGMTMDAASSARLLANSTTAETQGLSASFSGTTTATGFNINFGGTGAQTAIYIAIRRGPMATPTSGTQVFQPTVYTGTNVDNRLVNTTIAPDMVWVRQRNDTVLAGMVVGDRLRGQPYLLTGATDAPVNDANAFDAQLVSAVEYGTAFSAMNGFWCGNDPTAKLNANTTSNNHIAEAFKRAPGFFDVVCYAGTGAALTVNHGLAAVPELIINKTTSSTGSFVVYHKDVGNTKYLLLNSSQAPVTSTVNGWNNTSPTLTTFTIGANQSLSSNVAYLFATVAGVSKVGSYTGNGSSQTINCGFTGGSRFVLIKRTDIAGDWYEFDSARGIVAGNDPYLLLNSTAAEATAVDAVDTDNSGFIVNQEGTLNLNVTSATYIYLAIA